MTASDLYLGDVKILWVRFGADFEPVACVTSNTFSENSEVLETTTADNDGWKSFVATNQGYNLSVEGLMIDDFTAPNDGKVSANKLKILKRSRTIFDWELRTNSNEFIESGQALITDLSDGASVGEFISFSASMQGIGEPLFTNNELGSVTWDSTTITWDSTDITFDEN